MAGIIGVLSLNGNGFYPLYAEQMTKYIQKDFIAKKLVFPTKIFVIANQLDDNMHFKQIVNIDSESQWKYFRDVIQPTRYGCIGPYAMLNELGRSLPDDWIINGQKLDSVKAVKD